VTLLNSYVWCGVLRLQEYIKQKLQPTLVKALTTLAREKPTSSKLEALSFLAAWMLQHNPNKPQLQVRLPGCCDGTGFDCNFTSAFYNTAVLDAMPCGTFHQQPTKTVQCDCAVRGSMALPDSAHHAVA
jgi:hypothetical protein